MKKNLWYFTDQLGGTSQTFVDDLVDGLSKNENTDLTVICNSLADGFDQKKHSQYSVVVNKFLIFTSIRLKFLNFFLRFSHQHRVKEYLYKNAFIKLSKSLKNLSADAAYIDFGNVSVYVYTYLVARKIPFVVHFHGADITRALQDDTYRFHLSELFKHAQALIAPSHHMRRLLILEGAHAGKVHVVKYGVRTQYSPLKFEDRRPQGIVFLGRLTPKKNPVALIEAFNIVKRTLPEAALSVIGDGSELERVKARINQFGLNESVTLYGALKNEKALEIVRQHQLYVQHSVTSHEGDQEGFPISLAEAASLELPIISTIHNGIPENVIDGVTGFVVQEYDYEAMADKMITLLKDSALAKKMGQKGREHIMQLCDTQKRVQSISAILNM